MSDGLRKNTGLTQFCIGFTFSPESPSFTYSLWLITQPWRCDVVLWNEVAASFELISGVSSTRRWISPNVRLLFSPGFVLNDLDWLKPEAANEFTERRLLNLQTRPLMGPSGSKSNVAFWSQIERWAYSSARPSDGAAAVTFVRQLVYTEVWHHSHCETNTPIPKGQS